MEISIQLPDEVAERLHGRWQDLPRHALEALVADAYRQSLLSAAEVQGVLGLPSRYDADAFLKHAGADLDYGWTDLEEDLRTFREPRGGNRRHLIAQSSTVRSDPSPPVRGERVG